MKQALGLMEIKGLATAVLVADTMAKTANIEILNVEKTEGNGWITIKIAGDVGAVNAAISAGEQLGISHKQFVTARVIPRPADSLEVFFGKTTLKDNKKIEIIKPESEIKEEIIEKSDEMADKEKKITSESSEKKQTTVKKIRKKDSTPSKEGME